MGRGEVVAVVAAVLLGSSGLVGLGYLLGVASTSSPVVYEARPIMHGGSVADAGGVAPSLAPAWLLPAHVANVTLHPADHIANVTEGYAGFWWLSGEVWLPCGDYPVGLVSMRELVASLPLPALTLLVHELDHDARQDIGHDDAPINGPAMYQLDRAEVVAHAATLPHDAVSFASAC